MSFIIVFHPELGLLNKAFLFPEYRLGKNKVSSTRNLILCSSVLQKILNLFSVNEGWHKIKCNFKLFSRMIHAFSCFKGKARLNSRHKSKKHSPWKQRCTNILRRLEWSLQLCKSFLQFTARAQMTRHMHSDNDIEYVLHMLICKNEVVQRKINTNLFYAFFQALSACL